MAFASLLPLLLARITGKERYRPPIVWSSKSYVYNFFRLYELIFWREAGIRVEGKSWTNKGVAYHLHYTWEHLLVHLEGVLRNYRLPVLKFVKIPVPVLAPVPLGFRVQQPYMYAIAFVSTAEGTFGTSPVDLSFAVSGSNTLICAAALTNAGGNPVTAFTYNSIGLTLILADPNDATSYRAEIRLYQQIAPTTGTNTLSLSFSSGSGDVFITQFSGAKQTGQPDSSNSADVGTAATTATLATTVVAEDCHLVMAVVDDQGSGSTGLTNTTVDNTSGQGMNFAHSTATVASGSRSLSIDFAGSDAKYGAIIASFVPLTSTNYPMTAVVGAFTLTGIANLFHITVRMIAAAGSFALTGIAVVFRLGKGIVAATASFILTGIAVVFNFRGWTHTSKPSTTWETEAKPSSVWDYEDKL